MDIANLLSRLGTAHLVGGLGLGLGMIFLGTSLFPVTPLELARLEEVPAGESLSVLIQGDSGETLTLQLESPDGSDQTETAALDSTGQLKWNLSGKWIEKSGDYRLTADYGRQIGSRAVSEDFSVLAGMPSPLTSQIQLGSNLISQETATPLRVALKDAFGNPVVGHTLQISSDDPSVTVTTTSFVTDTDGVMNFSVQGGLGAPVSFQFYDATLGQNILSPVQVASAAIPQDQEVFLASQSGPIDAFVLTGLDDQTLTGDTESITVRAVDADGFTVTDYTGTLRFSSTDDQATLPNDYTFLADDLGEHTFSLGVKFVTPGDQSLSATDLDRSSVTGSISTSVVTTLQTSAETQYGSDFETTDFERSGDFTLISPASGSYSSSTVEIQGEAEYGYGAVIFLNDQEAGRAEIQFDNSFTYTLEDLADGTYELYVEIQDEEGSIHESSRLENVTIDTTPPTLTEIEVSPDSTVPQGSITLTVLSDRDLGASSAVLNGQVFALSATNTPGKYTATLTAPETPGTFSVDLLLADPLENEAQIRSAASITVSESVTTPAASNSPETPATPSQTNPSSTASIGEVFGIMTRASEERVALSWEPALSEAPLAYYRVYYGPYADALYAVEETFDASTQWTIKGLEADQLYYFAIAAVDVEGNEGSRSATVSATPQRSSDAPPVQEVPTYPVYNGLSSVIHRNPETGPAETALLLLSGLGAGVFVFLRRR